MQLYHGIVLRHTQDVTEIIKPLAFLITIKKMGQRFIYIVTGARLKIWTMGGVKVIPTAEDTSFLYSWVLVSPIIHIFNVALMFMCHSIHPYLYHSRDCHIRQVGQYPHAET